MTVPLTTTVVLSERKMAEQSPDMFHTSSQDLDKIVEVEEEGTQLSESQGSSLFTWPSQSSQSSQSQHYVDCLSLSQMRRDREDIEREEKEMKEYNETLAAQTEMANQQMAKIEEEYKVYEERKQEREMIKKKKEEKIVEFTSKYSSPVQYTLLLNSYEKLEEWFVANKYRLDQVLTCTLRYIDCLNMSSLYSGDQGRRPQQQEAQSVLQESQGSKIRKHKSEVPPPL